MQAWKRFLRNKPALISTIFLLLVALSALLAPWIAPYPYDEQDILSRLQGSSSAHWMGTDLLGRDLLSRILYGARVSLTVGVVTALVALILGTVTGAAAGYRGGWLDQLLMRFMDLLYSFPSLLLAILLMVWLGQGLFGIILALSITAWVNQARLVRGQVLQAREQLYVESARALGLKHSLIIGRHILPNIVAPVLISLTYQIPANIMAESFLSFIGLGIQPPHSSWGTLANEGFRAMRSYPHLIFFPGTALFLTMLAFNYFGDGLSDAFNPRLKR